MKLLFARAVSWVFGGMKRANGVALVGSHRLVVPLVAVAMPCPTPAPPAAAAAGKKRPSPLTKKMKLLFARAVSWVFGVGGMKRTNGVALVGSFTVLLVIRVVTFRANPEVARSWLPFLWAWLFVLLDIACWNCIYYFMEYYLPAEAGAAVQLPPPPPEMDMC